MPNECARIHIPDYGNFMAFKIRLRGFLGAPVRRETRKFANDKRLNVRTRSLFVVRIRTDISDVRVGEADYLSGVARIRENFLISREAGIENSFSAPAGFSARSASYENSPVFQRKRGGLSDLMGQRILLNLLS
jgi:hypothetical protein